MPKTLDHPSNVGGRAPDREPRPSGTALGGAGGRGLTLARVWGISIVIHPSWLAIFGLITWSLAVEYFPQEYRGFSGMTTWGLAIATSLAFFASILIHELAHSRIALAYGIPIRRITLFVFGGVAEIEKEAASAGIELQIALGGPLTSLALGLLFGAAAVAARGVDVLAIPLLYLARINVMVAVFNMVPGFPLDGGRAFRALMWWWTGSLGRATRVASMMGRGVGAIFMIVGLLIILRGNVLDGVWLGLIGWLLQ